METRKDQAIAVEEKLSISARKKVVQLHFRDYIFLLTGLILMGSSTRRAFKNPENFSQINEVEFEVIKRLHIFLITITCTYQISIFEFGLYCAERAKLMSAHDWYIMPISANKSQLFWSKNNICDFFGSFVRP